MLARGSGTETRRRRSETGGGRAETRTGLLNREGIELLLHRRLHRRSANDAPPFLRVSSGLLFLALLGFLLRLLGFVLGFLRVLFQLRPVVGVVALDVLRWVNERGDNGSQFIGIT